MVSFPHVSPSQSCMLLSSPPYALHAQPISILLELITRKLYGEECKPYASVVTSTFLDPKILLSTLFSNTLSLHSSLSVSGQVSHPQKITAKLELCVLIINSSLISKHVVRNTFFDISMLCAFQQKYKEKFNA